MSLNRTEALEKLLKSYANWYDLERSDKASAPLVATGQFHEQGAGYALVKNAKMWQADRNEYVYFYSVPSLTLDIFDQCIVDARAQGEPLIKPDGAHMCSYVVAVILCDTADEASIKALKKYRRRKNFNFSLNGWMEVHTVCAELGKSTVASNADGIKSAQFIKSSLFEAQRKAGLLHNLFRK